MEFARALARVVAESKADVSVPVKRPSSWQTFLALIRGWDLGVQFAAGVAALICITGASWLVVQNVTISSRVVALDAQLRNAEAREQGLRNELATQSRKQPPPVAVPPSTPIVPSLVFLPGLARAETPHEQLVLQSPAQIAHIEIHLETRDDYPRFRVELSHGGEQVLTRGEPATEPNRRS